MSLFSFKGRLRRRTFLLITIPIFLVLLVLRFITIGAGSSAPDQETANGIAAMMFVVTLPLLWPHFAAAAKRNHDQGRSGWWALLLLIPLVNIIHWLILAIGGSQPGANKWGPNPTRTDEEPRAQAEIFS